MAKSRKPTTPPGRVHFTGKMNFAGKGGLLSKMPKKFGPPRETFDDLVHPGRPPIDRAPIIAIAEALAREYVEDTLSRFMDTVRDVAETRGHAVPGDTVLREICGPIFWRARTGRE